MKILTKDATSGEQLQAAFFAVVGTLSCVYSIFSQRNIEMLIFGWLLLTNLAILENRAMIRGLKAKSTQMD
ncbi:MAG: hypothetical protein KF886_15015 [Candidatus Hydrogenedentes bacterium]|nr:hypothetical protein [Candidatus Hydrogenedentota bacterium]